MAIRNVDVTSILRTAICCDGNAKRKRFIGKDKMNTENNELNTC